MDNFKFRFDCWRNLFQKVTKNNNKKDTEIERKNKNCWKVCWNPIRVLNSFFSFFFNFLLINYKFWPSVTIILYMTELDFTKMNTVFEIFITKTFNSFPKKKIFAWRIEFVWGCSIYIWFVSLLTYVYEWHSGE